jgi:hypothetical protein
MEVELCFASVWRLDRQPGLDHYGCGLWGGWSVLPSREGATQQMRDGEGLPSNQPEVGGT